MKGQADNEREWSFIEKMRGGTNYRMSGGREEVKMSDG